MQTYTCFILDDAKSNVAILSQLIGKTEGLILRGSSTDPFDYLNQMNAGLKTDILFLDIEMPGINGIELADLLPAETHIIFITAHEEFAARAWLKNGVDYLVKPVGYCRLSMAVEKVRLLSEGRQALERKRKQTEVLLKEPEENYHRAFSTKLLKPGRPLIQHTKKDFFFSKTGLKAPSIKHYYHDILYIHGMGTYVQIHFREDQREDIKYSLRKVEENFPGSFIRIHKSYIVNMDHIQSFGSHFMKLSNGTELRMGKEYRDSFLRYLEEIQKTE